ncbi:helix-turn-helix transcriptional regulator [Catellatospora vulcania]|uniref:helix-turn-helix transcriptional regulator n=1 Tax=Catellatospora vulcania TaxID=1460450 RepID=UPI0018AF6F99|nr:LuxR family transcriptional regulator [Catellatospora vulcania]
MYLAERDDQLSALDTLAALADAGRGQVAVVTGPPATGRTALLQAAAERLQQRMLVLHAACAPAERSLPGGVLGQLWHSAVLPAAPLRQATTLLDRIAAQAATVAAPVADPLLLQQLHTLCLHLREIAGIRPVVIAVDDVRHADDVSLAFLQQLARRLRTYRVLLVLADRAEPDPVSAPFLAELQGHLPVHPIRVGPLSPQGVARLLRPHVPPADLTRRAAQVHAATGGNPLLVTAVLTDVDHPEPALARALADCLQRAEPALRHIAQARAVLHDPDTHPRALLDLPADDIRRGLDTLESAGLLHDGRFRTEAARAAVLADIPHERRAALHTRAAEALQRAAAPARQVVEHLLQAGRPARPEAVPLLIEAAEQAPAGSPDAARCLELALRAQTDPHAAAAIRARLCQADTDTHPAAALHHFTPLLADLLAGRLNHREGILLTRRLLAHGRTDEAGRALAALRAAATGSAALRDLETWLAYTHPALAQRRAVPTGEDPPALLAPEVDPWLHACASIADALLRGQHHEAADRALRLLADLHLGRHTGWSDEALAAAVTALVRADRLDTAASWCARLADDATDRPAPWRAAVAAAFAEVSLAQGDLPAAAAHATRALAETPAKAWGAAAGPALGTLVVAYARLGRDDQAAATLAPPIPDGLLSTRYGLHHLYARAEHHLATRHHHAALADFLACGELIRGWGLDVAEIVPWRSGAAAAWLRLGNQDQARRLAGGQLHRPTGNGARTRGVALRLLAAAGPAGRRPPLLLESLDLLESCGDRFEQARTLADLAEAYHLVNEDRRARMVFRRALHLARSCAADPLHRELVAVGSELGVGGDDDGDRDGAARLTGSEHRVAALAAIGYTNREIALKLYITSSTVEQHLTRVYRKLNVKHRRELPIDLSRRGTSVA